VAAARAEEWDIALRTLMKDETWILHWYVFPYWGYVWWLTCTSPVESHQLR